jgi:hypothetical protein
LPGVEGTADAAPPKQPKPVEVPEFAFALSRELAAKSLTVSPDYFDQHVKPDLRVIQEGRRILIPVSELQRWVNEKAARALKE